MSFQSIDADKVVSSIDENDISLEGNIDIAKLMSLTDEKFNHRMQQEDSDRKTQFQVNVLNGWKEQSKAEL